VPAALAALVIALGSWPILDDPGGVAALWLFAFVCATIVMALATALIGLPLSWLLASRGLERPWSYPLAGLLAGAALVLLVPLLTGGDPLADMSRFTPVGALPGALSGAIWWFAHRRHEQPDAPEVAA
jgi:hypothetical protein